MKAVQQRVSLIWATPNPALTIERIARVCYKSEVCIGEGTAASLIRILKARGHLAMLEHASASMLFTTDRGITHEQVRHRLASYAQESTRYCNYSKGRFGEGIVVIEPPGLRDVLLPTPPHMPPVSAYDLWETAVMHAESRYLQMVSAGVSPQIARSVLPTCLKSDIVVTANFREWLHILKLRGASDAHPQFRELISMVRPVLQGVCPEVFE